MENRIEVSPREAARRRLERIATSEMDDDAQEPARMLHRCGVPKRLGVAESVIFAGRVSGAMAYLHLMHISLSASTRER
ncbi:MAG: hypothetical protein ACR2LK_15635 [Solirubrobacteraceae bacterium]